MHGDTERDEPPTAEDARTGLIVNSTIGSLRLVAVAEPARWNEEGITQARGALGHFVADVERRAGRPELTLTMLLERAFQAANAHLLNEAATAPHALPGQEGGVGLAAVLLSSSEIVSGVVGSAQVLLHVAGRWTAVTDFAPRASSTRPAPNLLGRGSVAAPRIASSWASPRDTALVVSGETARWLQRQSEAERTFPTPAALLAALDAACRAGEPRLRPERCLAALGRYEPPPARPGRRLPIPVGRAVRSRAEGNAHGADGGRDGTRRGWPGRPRAAGHTTSDRRRTPGRRGATRFGPRWVRVVVVVVVLALAFGVVLIERSSQPAAATPGSASLERARQSIERAAVATDPGEVDTYLADAEIALVKAEADGAPSEEIEPLYAEIATRRDQALDRTRLGPIRRVGGLPGAADPAQAELVLHEGQLYVVDGALYQMDVTNATLIEQAGPGDELGGAPVQTLVGAASDDASLVLTDGVHLFRQSPEGQWEASLLASPLSGGGMGEVFDGNYYWLDLAADQILRFRDGGYGDMPRHWLEDHADIDLSAAVDFEVDGHIYVLLRDGMLVDLFKGQVATTERVVPAGATREALGLALPPRSNARYLLFNGQDGATIVRTDRVSGGQTVYLPIPRGFEGHDPEASAALGRAVSFVVDEGTATFYFIADGAVWTGSLVSQ